MKIFKSKEIIFSYENEISKGICVKLWIGYEHREWQKQPKHHFKEYIQNDLLNQEGNHGIKC